MVILLLAIAGTARAQAVPVAFAVHPYLTSGDLAASRFWTPGIIALVALDGAAKAADSFATRENIADGGEEYNPLARPFVHTTGVQVASMAATFAGEIAAAYWLHRRRHDNLERAVLASGAIMNGLGAASSFQHRVAGW